MCASVWYTAKFEECTWAKLTWHVLQALLPAHGRLPIHECLYTRLEPEQLLHLSQLHRSLVQLH